jgi:hypothetical protein
MDAVGFLCKSLVSSTFQIHDRLGSRRHARVQRLVSVVRMATVLEECITEEQCSFVRFLWEKELNIQDIHKERFPIYGGKCLSRKVFLNWVEKLPP